MSAGNYALYRSFCELYDLPIWPTGNQLEDIQRAGLGRDASWIQLWLFPLVCVFYFVM